MKDYRIRLKFKMPIHIGYKDGEYNLVSSIIHSDTLFSGIINAYNLLFGEKQTKKLLDFIINDSNSFIISSAFFYYKNKFFYPKPLGYKFGLDNYYDFKKIKKLEYVTKEYLEKEVENPVIEGNFAFSGKSIKDFVFVEERPRIALDRITQETTIYYMAATRFVDESGLWFYLSLDESIKKEIFAALHLLSDEGIGGERTYGYGAFDFEIDEIAFGNTETGIYLLLSTYYPKNNEELKSVLAYKISERTGYIFSPYNTTLKHPLVRFLSEGTIFKKHVKGTIVDVTPIGFEHHRIYKYGRAYLIPIKKEAQE
ncbi:MAG: type III-A CRISPR-associated RAMP protein Csm4 [Thermosipho sp. (in: Bacteria)]|nr:type III-A CRISPR-associated RAMP protein Csm4 [Thermosipho sp. (in: thermotogales)]